MLVPAVAPARRTVFQKLNLYQGVHTAATVAALLDEELSGERAQR
ncbi:MAG: hypothetical protein ABWX74_10745 [Aeromicrobium sp.]